MAQNITIQLTDKQVQQALVYARKVKPDATNQELISELQDAAYFGPGIREVIAGWEVAHTREVENANRAAAQAEFLEDFPAKVEDGPEPAEVQGHGKADPLPPLDETI